MIVTLVDCMGSDLSVVQAARVSFDKADAAKRTEKMNMDLLRFLATGLRNKERDQLATAIINCETMEEAKALVSRIRKISTHFTPFTHAIASFHIEAPIFVARQLMRSTVGLTVNEVSGRYVVHEGKTWQPERWRGRPADVKQGSGGEPHMSQDVAFSDYRRALGQSAFAYNCLTTGGVAPEMARAVLPLASYTAWVWTGSIYAFARVCNQRLDDHAQAETRQIAEMISAQLAPRFPLAWKALME